MVTCMWHHCRFLLKVASTAFILPLPITTEVLADSAIGTTTIDDAAGWVSPANLRVYVAELPEQYIDDFMHHEQLFGDPFGKAIDLTKDLYDTDQFATDVWFYFQWLRSPLRVHDIAQADIVFVPSIVGRANPYWDKYVEFHKRFVDMFNNTSTLFPHLKQVPHVVGYSRVAWDNFNIIAGPIGKNFIFTTIEPFSGQGQDLNHNLVTIPYASNFHFSRGSPNWDKDFNSKEVLNSKNLFVTEAYDTKRSLGVEFRKMLRSQCASRPDHCKHIEWKWTEKRKNDLGVALDTTHRSWYCLQPPGDSPTRRAFWDCLFVGSIPVVFDEIVFEALPFQHIVNWREIVVYIPHEHLEAGVYNAIDHLWEMHNVEDALRRLQRFHEVRRYFQYSMTPRHELLRFDSLTSVTVEDDAFTIAWKEVMKSVCRSGQLPGPRCLWLNKKLKHRRRFYNKRKTGRRQDMRLRI